MNDITFSSTDYAIRYLLEQKKGSVRLCVISPKISVSPDADWKVLRFNGVLEKRIVLEESYGKVLQTQKTAYGDGLQLTLESGLIGLPLRNDQLNFNVSFSHFNRLTTVHKNFKRLEDKYELESFKHIRRGNMFVLKPLDS